LPFDFNKEFDSSTKKELSGVGMVHIVSLPTLIAMKESVGRDQDVIDVRELSRLANQKK